MTRTELINSFIRRRSYRSYLEVGLGAGLDNFRQVECAVKRGIDPFVDGSAGCLRVQSDAFFAQSKETFDVIFVDGLHEEEQVDRDIVNALLGLNEGGVVILHDCLPPDEWHQRGVAEFHAGESWNGTVWKSVLKYFACSEWCCYVVDCDWGCGVIDTARRSARPRRYLPPQLEYQRDFRKIGDYVVGVGRFLIHQYNVVAFYHVAAMGNWKAVVAEHLQLLAMTELDTVRVSYVGDLSDVEFVAAAAAEVKVNALLVSRHPELVMYETPAMRLIEGWAQSRPSLGSILYFHTKGVSAPEDPGKRSWRQLMNHEVLASWQQCVLQLDEFDVVGVNWRDCAPISHFSGNFWWARSDWVRALAPFDAYYEHPRYPSDMHSSRRLGCEFWISSALRAPRVRSLACTNQDFGDPAFWSRFSHPALC